MEEISKIMLRHVVMPKSELVPVHPERHLRVRQVVRFADFVLHLIGEARTIRRLGKRFRLREMTAINCVTIALLAMLLICIFTVST